MNKPYYRQQAIALLTHINAQNKKAIEQKLFNHLMTLDKWKNAYTIGISISLDYEWNTEPIIRAAWEYGKVVAVPKCYPDTRNMHFYKMVSYEGLENVYHQLHEPNPNKSKHIKNNMIDLLIVPGLYFDDNGYRIGFGGGYYDRYLKNYPNSTLSLTSESLVVNELPRDSFDIPVDLLITENGPIR